MQWWRPELQGGGNGVIPKHHSVCKENMEEWSLYLPEVIVDKGPSGRGGGFAGEAVAPSNPITAGCQARGRTLSVVGSWV